MERREEDAFVWPQVKPLAPVMFLLPSKNPTSVFRTVMPSNIV